jgi:hypothetical protein
MRSHIRQHLHFISFFSSDFCPDIVESYRLAAERLGCSTSSGYMGRKCVRQGVINILFLAYNQSWMDLKHLHPDCIIVNLEHMVPGSDTWCKKYRNVLRHCYLWEYSKSNFHRYTKDQINSVDYVPLGYEAESDPVTPFAAVLPDSEQDIDVVFFGSLTQRRMDIITSLTRKGLRVVYNEGGCLWPSEVRDEYLRRAKVVLNLHLWETSRIVEVARLSILLRRRKAIVCELYPDSELDPALREAVEGAPYHELVQCVETLLANPLRRVELERKGLQILERHSQASVVGPALERFIAWRARQPDRLPLLKKTVRVTLCMVLKTLPLPHLINNLRSWSNSAGVAVNVVLIASSDHQVLGNSLEEIEGLDVRLVRASTTHDRGTCLNAALAQSSGEYIVFCNEEDEAKPERLSRQVALLETDTEVDIVGCWVETNAGTVKYAQRHHDILAECLGPSPLQLSACLLRKSFFQECGTHHDPEYDFRDDLHFVCQNAVAGARFAVIPEVLHRTVTDAEQLARAKEQSSGAKSILLGYLLPQASGADIQMVTRLYDSSWPSSSGFAADLLTAVARVTGHHQRNLQAEHEALTRTLRHEALRMLSYFFDVGLIGRQWLIDQFSSVDVSTFLAPARDQHPLSGLFVKFQSSD